MNGGLYCQIHSFRTNREHISPIFSDYLNIGANQDEQSLHILHLVSAYNGKILIYSLPLDKNENLAHSLPYVLISSSRNFKLQTTFYRTF